MRTAPASTIGEIDAGNGRAATAIASGVSVGGTARPGSRMRSSTTATLDALMVGRVSVSVIASASKRPFTRLRVAARFVPNSWKLLGKDSQEMLIGRPKMALMGIQFGTQRGLIGGEHPFNHIVEGEALCHALPKTLGEIAGLLRIVERVHNSTRQRRSVEWPH